MLQGGRFIPSHARSRSLSPCLQRKFKKPPKCSPLAADQPSPCSKRKNLQPVAKSSDYENDETINLNFSDKSKLLYQNGEREATDDNRRYLRDSVIYERGKRIAVQFTEFEEARENDDANEASAQRPRLFHRQRSVSHESLFLPEINTGQIRSILKRNQSNDLKRNYIEREADSSEQNSQFDNPSLHLPPIACTGNGPLESNAPKIVWESQPELPHGSQLFEEIMKKMERPKPPPKHRRRVSRTTDDIEDERESHLAVPRLEHITRSLPGSPRNSRKNVHWGKSEQYIIMSSFA